MSACKGLTSTSFGVLFDASGMVLCQPHGCRHFHLRNEISQSALRVATGEPTVVADRRSIFQIDPSKAARGTIITSKKLGSLDNGRITSAQPPGGGAGKIRSVQGSFCSRTSTIVKYRGKIAFSCAHWSQAQDHQRIEKSKKGRILMKPWK